MGRTGGAMGRTGGAMGRTGGAMGRTGGAMGRTGGAIGRTGGAIGRTGGAIGRTGGAIGRTGGAIGRIGGAIGRTGGAIGRTFQQSSVRTTINSRSGYIGPKNRCQNHANRKGRDNGSHQNGKAPAQDCLNTDISKADPSNTHSSNLGQ